MTPDQFTGQGYIESILQKTFSFPISVFASSRTDKGVHAREQKFTFHLPFFLTNKKLFGILKKRLEEYVLVKKVEKVGVNFHPPYNVVEYNLPLETTKLDKILQLFRGQHDFFNYCYCRYQDREKTNTVRQIDSIRINCYEGKQTIFDLKKRLTNEGKYKNLAPPSGLYL
ncbi:5334_t:CDS:2 [Racocetra fulgida]|uniref:5334_t:CDS:1 n=1 Tax=Racocetra fulgida TaxID=60492 RepID=A0A9N9EQK0_9GLOM|nr:5334_t:CDS:2 [Racocetra fulgida]